MKVVKYEPGRGSFGRPMEAVSLAGAEWDQETAKPDPRPETEPPRGIPLRVRDATIHQRVEIIRQEWIRARVEA